MTLVADASFIVSALVEPEADGRWAREILAHEVVVAPHLLPAETANALRGAVLTGRLTEVGALRAYADLMELPIVLYDYHEVAGRIWELRNTITVYDAWYVALAEALEVPLATLDLRLARAPGTRCAFLTPPA